MNASVFSLAGLYMHHKLGIGTRCDCFIRTRGLGRKRLWILAARVGEKVKK